MASAAKAPLPQLQVCDLDEPPAPPAPDRGVAPRGLVLLESLSLLVLGYAILLLMLRIPLRAGADIGVPGNDDYYHLKMAAMLPEWGLVREFPWLQFSYFRNEGLDFVSHHTGFHVLLMPFVLVSHALTGEYYEGGRVFVALCFGVNLVLLNLLLRAGNVPWRWLWLILFLLLPSHFYTRHAFIRAIGPSLIFMQLALLLLFRQRVAWAALALAAYVHLYLGAVLYGPVLVALYALAQVLLPGTGRRWPWKMVLITAAGWTLGVLTYPYARGMLEFLQLQVFGTGLTPDVEVGVEWQPYATTWWFVSFAASILAAWTLSLVLRLWSGPRLNAEEFALLLLQFAFLLLTLKARRFIEYWPPLALLSAAYLAAPALRPWDERIRGWLSGGPGWRTGPAWAGGLLAGAAIAGVTLWRVAHGPEAERLLAEWPLWTALLALLLLAPLTRIWVAGAAREQGQVPLWRLALVPLFGSLAAAGLAGALLTLRPGGVNVPAKLVLPAWTWSALAALYIAAPVFVFALTRPRQPFAWRAALVRSAGVVVLGLALFGTGAAVAGPRLAALAREMGSYFDVPAIRGAMEFLQANSEPGDVVFTDDWDIFPVYFYHNSHNYYIVGLDPEFTNKRRPDLWERYVRISRGDIPTTSRVKMPDEAGNLRDEMLTIKLTDIREHFGAKFVITDRDHRALAQKLARNTQFAELLYPARGYEQCKDAPHLIFRVRDPDEPGSGPTVPQPDAAGHLYLTLLEPTSVEQGFGVLHVDQTVDGRTLRLRGRAYRRGFGTHAPARLAFTLPQGYEYFEATVGVDDETGGDGTVIARVLLDGEEVFRSDELTGLSAPAVLRVPLGDARELVLIADPTSDGQRFDHVDWVDARLVREVPEQPVAQ